MAPFLTTIVALVFISGCDASNTVEEEEACDAASFLNLHTASLRHGSNQATCADLTNHGTHFTVDVEVGTPPQKFSVVADTGSNSLIVPSCICQKERYCSSKDRCFTGTNKSSTFSLKKGPGRGLSSVLITFGSGTIEAIVAKEQVAVGHLGVNMSDGILLMVAKQLNIPGSFEGILGLGLPSRMHHEKHKENEAYSKPLKAWGSSHGPQSSQAFMKKILGILGGHGIAGGVGGGGGGGNIETDRRSGASLPFPPQLFTELAKELGDIGDITLSDLGLSMEELEALDNFDEIKKDAIANLVSMRLGQPAQLDMGHSPQRRLRGPAAQLTPGFSQHAILSSGITHKWKEAEISPKGLLEQAGVDRFSMCFNDGSSGVLNLGIPEMEDTLPSVGKFHWSLDFRGISIGNSTKPLKFCSAANMTKGQETPCGAIPDSGTTVIMAPKEHITELLESLCDSWDRCAKNHTAMVKAAKVAKKNAAKEYGFNPFHIAPASKSLVLKLLLIDCGAWLTESKGLNELPPLKFHMPSSNNTTKLLELPGWAYVIESTLADAASNQKRQGIDDDVALLENDTAVKNQTSHSQRKVCSLAFGSHGYQTGKNGPVWILGTPFFYEYHVGYDMASSPPRMSFTSTASKPCVTCGKDASLLTSTNRDTRRPRFISGPMRIPDIDMDLPL